MAKEVEDIEFDELIADKRHRELRGILSAIKLLLEKPADNSTTAAIQKMAGDLSKLLSEQKSAPITVNSPDVNVEVNQEKVVTSVTNLSKDLLEELKKFNERPMVDSFKLETSNWGAKAVKVVYTTQDKLTYKK